MKHQILIVDDDPTIVRLLEVNFRLDGFDVQSAGYGEDALTLAEESPPDVILLDVMMPGLDGYEVYRRLREIPALERTPVFFLSARAREDAKSQEILSSDPGVVDYITKPFDPAELVAIVRLRLEGEPG